MSSSSAALAVPRAAFRVTPAERQAVVRYLEDEQILFEDRALPVVPEPLLIDAAEDERRRDRFRRLHAVLEKGVRAVVADEEAQAFMGLPEAVRRLLPIAPGYAPWIFFCRFDYCVAGPAEARILELNADCPGGLVHAYHVFQALRRAGILARLESEVGVPIAPLATQVDPVFPRALLSLYRRTRGPGRLPRVALVHSRHKTLRNELARLREQLNVEGMAATIGFVEDLVAGPRGVVAAGLEVDLAYGKFDTTLTPDFELPFTPRACEAAAYLSAIRRGQLLAVNSFPSCYVAENKAFLAFLRSPGFLRTLSDQEQRLVLDLIAETQVVRASEPRRIAGFRAGQDGLVLKQSLDTRGRSVVIGRAVDPATWNRAIDAALADPSRTWVIQEFVETETAGDRPPDERARYLVHAYFLLDGEPVGMLPRCAAERITSVGRSGALRVPIVVGG